MFAAFLRGVNVGRRAVAMADVRASVAALGYKNVSTVLQSGTVVFDAGRARAASIEKKLEAAFRNDLQLETSVSVRSADEIRAIVEANPFDAMAKSDPSHLIVVILKVHVENVAIRALRENVAGREAIEAGDRVLYVTYPDGIGESKLTAAAIDRALRTTGTARNWNTVQRTLSALVTGPKTTPAP
jgi:uncharacterized protein (DUF1697 family)